MTNALDLAKQAVGGGRALAHKLGISPPAVYQWRRVPVARVLDVERVTGVARHDLRPDIYPAPPVSISRGNPH